MKQNMNRGSLFLLLFVLQVIACKKTVEPGLTPGGISQHDTSQTLQTPLVPFPVNPMQECNNAPDYGDSVLFAQPAGSTDSYAYPQNNQGITGTYLSWPVGLSLNPNTGAIDLTRSETGQRYAVAFVKGGTSDTCMSQLIIGGASYMDSVYELTVSTKTSPPYFNANLNAPSACQGNQPGPGCQFDYNDFAIRQGIAIDRKTGFIDLVNTMKHSPFGPMPFNGETIYTTVFYKLDDQSNNAPQSIRLKLVYYNHTTDIPAALLSTITGNIQHTIDNDLTTNGPSARPPIIIIVRAH